MNSRLDLLEKALACIAAFIFTGGIVELVLSGGADEISIEYENTYFRVVFPLLYLILIGLLSLRWRKVLAVIRCNWLIVALIVFTAVSFLWSDSPSLTLRRNVALVGTSFLGLYLASRYTFKEQLHLLGWLCGVTVASSIAFAVLVPQLGISVGSHAGAWRGIFAHKNGLGDAMVISSLTFLVLAIDAQRRKWLMWSALAASVALVFLSESVGSLLSLAVPLTAFPIYRSLRWRYSQLVPFVLLVLLVSSVSAGWLWLNFDQVMISLGKDPSLTGRTEIWSLTIDSILRQPWLGYGYKTFWQDGLEGPSAYVFRAMGVGEYLPPHAHNGILQLSLDIGVVGVVIFLLGFWRCLLTSIHWVRSGGNGLCFWPLLFLSYMVVTNMSESRILSYNSFDCVLYFSTAFSLGQPLELLEPLKSSPVEDSKPITSQG
ncbi:MAG: O-antigen ligase [Cyanobacteria bacterium J06629_19]